MENTQQKPIIDKKELVREFGNANLKTSLWQIVNSVGPYLATMYLMYKTLEVSYLLTLALAVLGGGFLIRIFIIFHDCGHNSFFNSQQANYWAGSLLGLLLYFPFAQWKFDHAKHHTSVCNLDFCGIGDIWTMSTKDYRQASKVKRFLYRLSRTPMFFLLFPPLFLKNRIVSKGANQKQAHSVHMVNLWLVSVAVLACYTIGLVNSLLIQLPILIVASAAGIWLFYVQHQFEGAYWQRSEKWDQTCAALRGTSCYKLPKVLQWFTGNIGFHNVHHLSPKIPNYNLERCYKKSPALRQVPVLTLADSFKALRSRLWDEDEGNFVSFKKVTG